ncbi:MAG TPA: DUF3833 family protein [Sphingomicrobium sp.]
MHAIRALLPIAAIPLIGASAPAAEPIKPMQFFEGRTEGSGVVRIFLNKSYRTRSVGRGRIQPDGSLLLVQRVEDHGKPAHERRWKIHQTGPRTFAGTMSEALGPVKIDQVGDRYRFRFRMKGDLSVEQWLAPQPGGKSANNSMTIRKFGVRVGKGEGTIRRVSAT